MRANWIEATSATGGTGALTLTDVTNRPNFDDVFAGTTLVEYVIEEEASGKFESGIGSFVASTKVLTRTQVLSTYTGGTYDATTPSAVSFGTSGVTVRCAPTADLTPRAPVSVQSALGDGAYVSTSVLTAASPGNAPLTANREYFAPFYWPGGRVSSVAIYVSALATSAEVKVALYRVGANGLPGARIWSNNASPFDATGTGLKAASVSLHLPPGWYYYAYISGHAPSLRAALGQAGSPLGYSTGIPINYVYVAGSFATGLADPAATPTVLITNSVAAALFLGVA